LAPAPSSGTARTGDEDRHGGIAQRRKAERIQVRQIGVDDVDQARIERHRHAQVG
jgi:hypothetical protein